MRALLIALAVMLGIVSLWPYSMLIVFGFVIGYECGETRHGR